MLNKHLPIFLFIEEKKLTIIGQQEKAKLRKEQGRHNRSIWLPILLIFLFAGGMIKIALMFASVFPCLVPIVGLSVFPLMMWFVYIVEAPFNKKMQRHKQAWLSTYGSEVVATVTKRKLKGADEGTTNIVQFTWLHSTQQVPLSFWEAECSQCGYHIGEKYLIWYDPTDLSFHRVPKFPFSYSSQ